MENNTLGNQSTNSNQPQQHIPSVPQSVPSTSQPIEQQAQKSHKTIFIVLGCVLLGIIILAIIIILLVFTTSKKMTCNSPKGNITIMYNDDTINGYAAEGLTYDLDQQKILAERIGVSNYLDEFSDWFSENTGGICQR